MPGTTNNVEFNTTAQTMWDKLPEWKLNELMMHELSHEYDTEDNDSKGVLANAHHLDQLMNFDKDISRFIFRPSAGIRG